MLISKIFKFDAAHKLPGYNGKCKDLHGHTWKLIVAVEGEVKEDGMVRDFREIKQIVNGKIIDKLDHGYLNEIIENPTTENILLWIKKELDIEGLRKLTLYETEDCFAELIL